MKTVNLLAETSGALTRAGVTADSVRWVGSQDGACAISWAEFATMAAAVNYDNGYGGAEIATCLCVVGDSWWLERQEYDGSEWWEFKSLPVRSSSASPFASPLAHVSPSEGGLDS